MDLLVKKKFFDFLNGSPKSSFDDVILYVFHIEKRKELNARVGYGTDRLKPLIYQYLYNSRDLVNSMKKGFLDEFAIPVDRNGELLDGAHRISCALALGIETVPVESKNTDAFAPDWGYRWFLEAGLSPDYVSVMRKEWETFIS
jgi:hypothetical protein